MPRGEGIKPLGSLFEKYKNQLRAPQGSVVSAFCEVVEDLYGYSIGKDKVMYSVRSRTLSLRISGPLKTEIQLKKKEILTHLKGRLGEKSAPTNIL